MVRLTAGPLLWNRGTRRHPVNLALYVVRLSGGSALAMGPYLATDSFDLARCAVFFSVTTVIITMNSIISYVWI